MQRFAHLVVIALVPATMIAACGSRGPLDDNIVGVVDAGVADVVVADQGSPEIDSGAPDTGFDAGTGPIQCAECVGQTCGPALTACIADPSCTTILQCIGTTCLGGGGGLDPSCLTGCTGGGGPGVGEALGVFQCITNDCGNACGGLLGGLGGFGGG